MKKITAVMTAALIIGALNAEAQTQNNKTTRQNNGTNTVQPMQNSRNVPANGTIINGTPINQNNKDLNNTQPGTNHPGTLEQNQQNINNLNQTNQNNPNINQMDQPMVTPPPVVNPVQVPGQLPVPGQVPVTPPNQSIQPIQR